jgi:hypothetical protein
VGAGAVPRSDDRDSAVKALAVVLLLSCSSVHAAGSFYTGNKLLQLLQSDNYQERGVAMGYVAGAIDMGDGVIFCSPSNTVTIGQVRDMVQGYLESTPSIRHMSADAIIIDLFKRLWPCPKRGTTL